LYAEALSHIQEKRLLSSPFITSCLTLFLTLPPCPNISAWRQLKEFSKKPKLKSFVNICREIRFCDTTKKSGNLHEDSTFYISVGYASLNNTEDKLFLFAGKSVVMRTRQTFFDLWIVPVDNNTLLYT
jgi:hypothetical protein